MLKIWLGMSGALLLAGLIATLALALPDTSEAALLDEVTKLTAADAQAGDQFGVSVSVSGDTAIVAARFEDALGVNAGAAYVYRRDQGGANNWGEVKKLTASDAEAGDYFGTSVAIDGDIAIVGARFESASGFQSGAAYLFRRDQGGPDNWGEVTKLIASDAQATDWFGATVSVSGDTAVVGAYLEDAGGDFAGAAYVFERSHGGADNWGEVTKLTASDTQAEDEFGASVAVSDDTVMVGAFLEDAAGNGAGAVYVFLRDQGGPDNWGEVAKLTASDAEAGDFFGVSVALSGDTSVVGADAEDAGGSIAGAAYVFRRDQGGTNNWGEVTKLTASDAQAGDFFGSGVAVSGDVAVVGAFREDAGGADAGAAYVFQRDQGGASNWGEVAKLTASDAQAGDFFGIRVAISGVTAIVGAYFEDTGGNNAGAAYVFEETLPRPTSTAATAATAIQTPLTATITKPPMLTPSPSATSKPPRMPLILLPVVGSGGPSPGAHLEPLDRHVRAWRWRITAGLLTVGTLSAMGGAVLYVRRRATLVA